LKLKAEIERLNPAAFNPGGSTERMTACSSFTPLKAALVTIKTRENYAVLLSIDIRRDDYNAAVRGSMWWAAAALIIEPTGE
jgi:hypothetical protein